MSGRAARSSSCTLEDAAVEVGDLAQQRRRVSARSLLRLLAKPSKKSGQQEVP